MQVITFCLKFEESSKMLQLNIQNTTVPAMYVYKVNRANCDFMWLGYFIFGTKMASMAKSGYGIWLKKAVKNVYAFDSWLAVHSFSPTEGSGTEK